MVISNRAKASEEVRQYRQEHYKNVAHALWHEPVRVCGFAALGPGQKGFQVAD